MHAFSDQSVDSCRLGGRAGLVNTAHRCRRCQANAVHRIFSSSPRGLERLSKLRDPLGLAVGGALNSRRAAQGVSTDSARKSRREAFEDPGNRERERRSPAGQRVLTATCALKSCRRRRTRRHVGACGIVCTSRSSTQRLPARGSDRATKTVSATRRRLPIDGKR